MEPNTPVKGLRPGIAAIDIDDDRYCLDCANKALNGVSMGFTFMDNSRDNTENWDNDEIIEMLIDGQIYTLDYGGVVLADSESPIMHCGMGENCENATKNHPYDHDCKVGGRLDLTEIEY